MRYSLCSTSAVTVLFRSPSTLSGKLNSHKNQNDGLSVTWCLNPPSLILSDYLYIAAAPYMEWLQFLLQGSSQPKNRTWFTICRWFCPRATREADEYVLSNILIALTLNTSIKVNFLSTGKKRFIFLSKQYECLTPSLLAKEYQSIE